MFVICEPKFAVVFVIMRLPNCTKKGCMLKVATLTKLGRLRTQDSNELDFTYVPLTILISLLPVILSCSRVQCGNKLLLPLKKIVDDAF
jgi:hypothetical protein